MQGNYWLVRAEMPLERTTSVPGCRACEPEAAQAHGGEGAACLALDKRERAAAWHCCVQAAGPRASEQARAVSPVTSCIVGQERAEEAAAGEAVAPGRGGWG